MHDKNKDTKSFIELGKYLLNGYFFDSIAKTVFRTQKSMIEFFCKNS